jgi:thioredoxin 1
MGKKAQRRRQEKIESKFAGRPALSLVPSPPADAVVPVTDATFDRDVLGHDLPVLVDFWAPWCGPCKLVGPILDELAPVFAGRLRIAKLNTEQNRRVPAAYNIRSIPSMILFRDGEVVDMKVGASPRSALERWLERHVAQAPAAPEPADDDADLAAAPVVAAAAGAPAAGPAEGAAAPEAARKPGFFARLFG